MANGIFKLKKQLLGVIQKAWPAVPTYSGLFNGTNQYLTTSSTSAFSFGSGNFTVEFWLNTDNTQTGNIINPNTGSSWGLLISAGNVLNWNNAYNVTSLFTVSASSISNSAWHHVALVRSSGTIYVYYDGVLQTSQADSTNYNASASTWSIGYGNVGYFKGYLSNLRITNTAVYTSAFTPPNTQLTAITGTQLLTLQNSTIVDNSPNALTITNNNAVTTPAQSFLPALKRTTNFVEYLVVAGGGGAGNAYLPNGGGGAGGLLQGIVPVVNGTTYTVTVGGGGAAASGSNSVFGSITAIGGGQAGGTGGVPLTGGSGGGGTNLYAGAQGVAGQGNAGGKSTGGGNGGGGGAGTVGLDAPTATGGGNGGAGIASVISGTVTTYAGGGGGSGNGSGAFAGTGGAGGGGNAAVYPTAGANGATNTGGGGGGGQQSTGGSGIVIIRYPNTFADATSVTNGTKTSITGFTVYTFLSSGSISF